ncbi:MAG: hypothetical protein LC637_10955 [Xanthomonadaceae bacterium]|nr:hypothetical protein [Xanthomonadaceae bacterium]
MATTAKFAARARCGCTAATAASTGAGRPSGPAALGKTNAFHDNGLKFVWILAIRMIERD